MIVTIDGPGGSGKSTAARGLAERLGFLFLDTGAMYRVVALIALEEGIDPDDRQRVAEIAKIVDVTFQKETVLSNGVDVSEAIRTPNVTEAASVVAQNGAVRQAMVTLQRRLAEGKNVVSEGRDQGTVAFPDAGCKFFLTADPEKRALRRQQEMELRGLDVSVEETLRQLQDRDKRDASRDVAPLKAADDAVCIDTTNMSIDETVDLLEQTVRGKTES
ncbi:MAG: (d)CMP kinase [Planctomycetes bacterium]|nr:(d)CMP kinase [Planctomycetota bacterium]